METANTDFENAVLFALSQGISAEELKKRIDEVTNDDKDK